jgi:hypothetical protein
VAVGQSITSAQLNSWLSVLALQICGWAYQVNQLQEITVSLSTAGLEAAGFSAPDAATFQTMASYLNTVAGVYQGAAAQGSQFNFDNALCLVRGSSATVG